MYVYAHTSSTQVLEIRKRDYTPVALTKTNLPGERPKDCKYLRFVLAKVCDVISMQGISNVYKVCMCARS